MIILANILSGLAAVLAALLNFCVIMLIARAVISWVNADPYNGIVRFIISVTDPITSWVSKRMPTRFGMIDLSPLIVLLIIMFIKVALVQSMQDYADRLRFQALRSETFPASQDR